MKRNRKALFIEGNRDCYAPSQMEHRTMTVGELIAMLEDYDPDALVFLRNDRGYTYGSLSDRDLFEAQFDDHRVYYEDDEGFDEELAYGYAADFAGVA